MFRTILAAAVTGLFALGALAAQAQDFETRATAAYVYDQSTGTVLLAKNADTPLPPASMSKLMTLYMTFEAIANGQLQPGDLLPVSEHAMSYGGSTMFLNTTDRVTVEDLIRGVVVLSGNDASAVLAEALSPDGTEAGFGQLMTERARQLGMTSTILVNSNGWPAPGHVMSMRDLGILSDRLITDFPTYYPLFAETTFDYDGRAPANSQNRNPILTMGIGADGLKTGHTQEAGYGLAGSAKQGDRRIIFVITGLDSAAARAEESQRIVNWAFRQFSARSFAATDSVIAEADVWMGAETSVGMVLGENAPFLVPALNSDSMTTEVIHHGPIEAPIAAGDRIGELVVSFDGMEETRLPLVADRDIARGGFTSRVRTAANVLVARFAPDLDLPGITTPTDADPAATPAAVPAAEDAEPA